MPSQGVNQVPPLSNKTPLFNQKIGMGGEFDQPGTHEEGYDGNTITRTEPMGHPESEFFTKQADYFFHQKEPEQEVQGGTSGIKRKGRPPLAPSQGQKGTCQATSGTIQLGQCFKQTQRPPLHLPRCNKPTSNQHGQQDNNGDPMLPVNFVEVVFLPDHQ